MTVTKLLLQCSRYLLRLVGRQESKVGFVLMYLVLKVDDSQETLLSFVSVLNQLTIDCVFRFLGTVKQRIG